MGVWHPLSDDKPLTVMGSLKRTREKKLVGLGTVLMDSQHCIWAPWMGVSVKNDDGIGIEEMEKMRAFGLLSTPNSPRLFGKRKPISSGDVLDGPARWEEHPPGQGQGQGQGLGGRWTRDVRGAVCGWIGEAARLCDPKREEQSFVPLHHTISRVVEPTTTRAD